MIYVRVLYAASGVFILLAGILLALALRDIDDASVPSLIAAGSFLAATAGWLFNNAVSVSTRTRDRTFAYLNRVTVDRALSARTAELNVLWAMERIDEIVGDEKAVIRYFLSNHTQSPLVTALKELGNIIEEIALAVRFKTVDEALLYAALKDYVGLYLTRIMPFLRVFRNFPAVEGHPYGQYSSEEIFAEAVWLGKRWRKMDLR